MKIFVKTYHQVIARLIIVSFSFIIILTAFHYHNYDILGDNSVKQQNQAEEGFPFLNDDLQIVCTIQFNYTKLHSINFADLSQRILSSDVQKSNYISPETYSLLSFNKLSHYLRAPPSL